MLKLNVGLNLPVQNSQKIKENSATQQNFSEKIYHININKLKELSREGEILEYVDVKKKLEQLSSDSWVPNSTPQIAKNILKNFNSKILSDNQINLINSIITQYTGRS